MTQHLKLAALALRLFMAWWVMATVVLGLVGTLMGEASIGFGLGCFFFPVVAGLAGFLGAYLQFKSCSQLSRSYRLSAFQQASIQLPMSMEEAEKTLAAILQEDLAASAFSMSGHRIHALYEPPPWSGKLRRWALSDEICVEFQETEGHGCLLEAEARPLSRLLYGVLWIDKGRNLNRLRRLQSLIGERMSEADRKKEASRKADSLEGQLAQAELLLLRAQVEPHFLFNTLAHLRELIRLQDTSAALSMLDSLISYSRAASDRIRQSTLSLGQELEALRGYLSLVQIRFGDRVDFEIQADPESLDREVPVGCLLIPVENAVKHGVEPIKTAGHISIRSKRVEETLILEVQDNGPGLQMAPATRRGTGLANLRERLKLLFEDSARLSVEDHEAGGVLVTVRMPAWNRPAVAQK